MTDAQTETRTVVDTRTGDHDLYAHYVIGGGEAIIRAMVTGEPCTALCGKVWVPSRDPSNYPVCPECEAIRKAAFGD